MRKEAERLTKEKKAERSRERYRNDPDESPKKRAAAKEYYKQHTPEKKAAAKEYYKQHTPEKRATMALYYEKHKEELNDAKRKQYQDDPEIKQAKSDYYNETRSHYGSQKCPECEKILCTQGDMKRHMDHAHAEDKFITCQVCDKLFKYKQNVKRHMTEIHGGERHKCGKCPAAFSRGSDLEEHIKQDWHYLSYDCKQCSKTIVFKNLKGLIEHTIVKQSREERVASDGAKYEICKSGITVTCKTQVKSTLLKEGKDVMRLTREDKVKASKKRQMKKEEIINEGLQLAVGNAEAPKVKLEFEYKKHEDDGRRKCKWCFEYFPYSNEHCTHRKPDNNWCLQRV